jgi:hypothetical protein
LNEKSVTGISPILQATLLKQMEQVLSCYQVHYFGGAWSALESLYNISPPCVKLDVDDSFYVVYDELDKINKEKKCTKYVTMTYHSREKRRYLKQIIMPLYKRIADSLYKHGYLETYGKSSKSNLDQGDEGF